MSLFARKMSGVHKLIHFPKYSCRKTLCRLHIMWPASDLNLPAHLLNDPTKNTWLTQEVRRDLEAQRLAKVPANLDLTMNFKNVTCPKCRMSADFQQMMLQKEFAESVQQWEEQFHWGGWPTRLR